MKNNLETFQRFAPKVKRGRELTSNAVIYTRVSSKEQDENTSLPYQKRRCEEYAERKGYRIVEYFGGTYESAKNDERKEFKRMMSFVKSSKEKISKIIVLSFDRFSRSGANSIYLIEILKQLNIFVESVTQEGDYTTPSGELLQNMQMLFSKMDNDQRRQKTVAGMQEMMRSGYLPHRAPIGYRHVKNTDWVNRIVLDEKIAPLIKKAFLLKANEGKSNTEIAELLSSAGLKIDRKRLTAIFANPFYCGILTNSLLPEEVIQGKQPKLISEEIFLKVNEIASKRKHGERQQKDYSEFPLKQFVKCDHCGTPLTAYHVKKKKATYYKCNTIGCKLNRNTKILHDKFSNRLNEYFVDPRSAKPIEKMMCRVFNRLNQSVAENEGLLQKQLLQVEANIETLTDKLIAKKISQEIFDQTLNRYLNEKKKIEEKLPKEGNKLSNLDEYIKFSVQISKSLPEMWVKGNFEFKQRMQNLVFPEGLGFNKEKNDYRTSRVFCFFVASALISSKLAQKKNGITDKNIEDSVLVAHRGIEPLFPG